MKNLAFFVVLCCIATTANSQNQTGEIPPQPFTVKQPDESELRFRINPTLLSLEQEYLAALKRGVAPAEFTSEQQLAMYANGMVRIEAAARSDVRTFITQLESLGATGIDYYERLVNAWLPIENISRLAELSELQLVRQVYYVSGDIGAATSEGDIALQAEAARDAFCVDGAGVRVGVISDSYTTAFPGGAAAGVASGDIPGVGNPNGFLTPVTVVQDGAANNIDEGRAMIEIIHDLAPGAQLFFNTSNGGQATYANAILNLDAVSNCDIIVDDVRYFEEPFYLDGVIAQACNTVFNNGKAYFASAGNYAQRSYESPYRNSGGLLSAHDFDPGPGVDTLQSITVNGGSPINLTLQWDDPWGSMTPNSAATNLDLFLINAGGAVVAQSTTNNVGGDPSEFLSFTAPAGGSQTFRIFISRVAGPAPSVLKWVLRNTQGLVINEYPPTTINAQATGYGHSNAAGANAIGAAFWGQTPAYGVNPPVPEPFTSSGGVQIRYNTNGVPITPITRNKPNFTAVDGTSNTFFGNGNNFFGTSAAAPHAAAVAALMLEANSGLTPTQVRNILVAGSIDMLTPGFDFVTGSGLIQADDAVERAVAEACNIDGIGVMEGPTCTGDGLYTVTLRISYSNPPGCDDELSVNGQVFNVAGGGFTDITLNNLPANGASFSANVFFVSTPSCSLFLPNLYTAPHAPAGSNTEEDVLCSGDLLSISLQSKITNGVTSSFSWTVAYNGVTGGNGNGSGAFINETLVNTTLDPIAVVYTVTPSNLVSGCSGVPFIITVNVPPALNSTAAPTSDYNGFNISCHGGSDGVAEAFPIGGTPPYYYLWNDPAAQTSKEATGLMAQDYQVTVTDDNGCSVSVNTGELTEPEPLDIDAGENQTVYFGYPPFACATLTWSEPTGGVPPYDISWSTGETTQSIEVCPEITTTYTVTLTDANNCVFTDDVIVCAIDVRCGKDLTKVEICHAPPGNPENEQTLCVGINSVEHHLAHGDILAACGTDHNCPPALDLNALIINNTGSQGFETEISVSPNPFREQSTLVFQAEADGQITLTLSDVTGRNLGVVFSSDVVEGEVYQVEIDASKLGTGMNYCTLRHSNGTVLTEKLVKMH